MQISNNWDDFFLSNPRFVLRDHDQLYGQYEAIIKKKNKIMMTVLGKDRRIRNDIELLKDWN